MLPGLTWPLLISLAHWHLESLSVASSQVSAPDFSCIAPILNIYIGEVHPWISRIITAIGLSALADAFKRFPAFAATFKWLFPKAIEKMVEDTAKHENYTIDLIDKYATEASRGIRRTLNLDLGD